MSASQVIRAVYEDGVLKPSQPLPLQDHQEVQVIVLFDEPRGDVDPARVRQLHEQADTWLAQQSAQAVREPKPLTAQERERLDAELDQLLAGIHALSASSSDAEIADEVDAAVMAVRATDD